LVGAFALLVVEESFLDGGEDFVVGALDDAVGLRMVYRGKEGLGADGETEISEVLLSNYLSLSTVSSDETPNRQTMFCQKNFWAVFDVIVDTALATIHFVKYSTVTKVNLRFP
jgi:hypothetical protein